MNLIYSSNTKIFNADKSDLASKFKYSEFLKKKTLFNHSGWTILLRFYKINWINIPIVL